MDTVLDRLPVDEVLAGHSKDRARGQQPPQWLANEFGAGPRPVIEKALADVGVGVRLPTLCAMVGAVRPMVVDLG